MTMLLFTADMFITIMIWTLRLFRIFA